ncbi:MAG: hypothetical protein J2P17_15505 [Mycobacterium sp.]|nr:hypothetical protein [Mycobacterium sp.]
MGVGPGCDRQPPARYGDGGDELGGAVRLGGGRLLDGEFGAGLGVLVDDLDPAGDRPDRAADDDRAAADGQAPTVPVKVAPGIGVAGLPPLTVMVTGVSAGKSPGFPRGFGPKLKGLPLFLTSTVE